MSDSEVFYSNTPPEALNNIENKTSTASDADNPVDSPSRLLSSRMATIVTAIIAAVVMGTAVGAGVGVGLRKQTSIGGSSTAVMSTVTRTASGR